MCAKPEANDPKNLAVLEQAESEGMLGGRISHRARIFEVGTSALGDDPWFDGKKVKL